MSAPDKREAIARVAERMRKADNQQGGSMTHDQARERIERAVERGDRNRDNNHR